MKVNLKIKEDNTVQTVQHEIEEVNLLQITSALKVIKEIIEIAEQDNGLKNLFVELFEQEGNEDEEALVAIFKSAAGAFDALLVNIPDKAIELLAVLANVEQATLMQQKPIDVMDIYDAVLEVNDMEKLVERGKKSLAATKKLSKIFKKPKISEATQAAQH